MKTEWSAQHNNEVLFTSGSESSGTFYTRIHFDGTGVNRSALSVSQFAEAARITPQAVRKMISEGRLKAARIGEQHVITREELNEYLAAR